MFYYPYFLLLSVPSSSPRIILTKPFLSADFRSLWEDELRNKQKDPSQLDFCSAFLSAIVLTCLCTNMSLSICIPSSKIFLAETGLVLMEILERAGRGNDLLCFKVVIYLFPKILH